MAIKEFQKDYRWLSNFSDCEVVLDGLTYRSVEYAYQAAKTLIVSERAHIIAAGYAGEAKRRGKLVTKRPDWEQVKLQVMEGLLLQKFPQKYFKDKLLATGDQELIEGNYYHDVFYGVCNGKCRKGLHTPFGDNHLGKLIMKIRDELRRGVK